MLSKAGINEPRGNSGVKFSIVSAETQDHAVVGRKLGEGISSFLNPFLIFKGKVRAAVTRNKFHDSADLRWLVGHFGHVIKPRVAELNLEYVGLAIQRFLILERLFDEIGVDTARAKNVVAGMDLKNIPAPAPGDVHKGLLG